MDKTKSILKIFFEELKVIYKDPATLLIMVFGVVLYAMFYSIPYSTELVRDVPIAVIDNDSSSLSRKLINDFDANESVKIAKKTVSIEDAMQDYYKSKIFGYVVIPKDFQKDILSGKKTDIALYTDSAYLILYKQVASGVLTSAATLSAQIEVKKEMKKGASKKLAISRVNPVNYIEMPLYNPSGGYESYIYPLVLVLILQQTMLVAAGLLAGTRREKNADKDVKNIPETILGRGLAYSFIYFCHAIFFFMITPKMFLFANSKDYIGLMLMIAPFLIATSFLAQALVIFFKERESSLLAMVATSVPMIFLPGFIWPKEAIPEWLNIIAYLLPSTSAIDGITKINQMGASFIEVSHDFIFLILLGILYFILANISHKSIYKN